MVALAALLPPAPSKLGLNRPGRFGGCVELVAGAAVPVPAVVVCGVVVDGAVTEAAVGGLVELTVADEVAEAAAVGGFTALALGAAVLDGGLELPTTVAECAASTKGFAVLVAAFTSDAACVTVPSAAGLPTKPSRFGRGGNDAGASADELSAACGGEETSQATSRTAPQRQSVPQGPTSGRGATGFLIALCYRQSVGGTSLELITSPSRASCSTSRKDSVAAPATRAIASTSGTVPLS